LFLQQCGNAPPARPNNFLRQFFVRPLTILPILDHVTSRLHGSVIVPAFWPVTELPSRSRRRELARLRKANPCKQTQINENKRKQISFHFLSFIFPNRDFSMGYGRFK
jgi:hypothetical protein